MKTKKNIFILLLIALFSFVSCSKSDTTTPSEPTGTVLGTYVGNLQVSDDPQTKLGYIYNAKVAVSTNGVNAIIKITGNEGFNREYTGTVFSSNATATMITIKKQTKPIDKTAGNDMIINNNSLTIDISLLSDKVVVKEQPTSTTTTEISGKLRMIGSNLLKE